MSRIDDEDLELDGLEADGPKWPEPTWDMPLRKPIELADGAATFLQLREATCQEWEEIQAHPVATRRRYAVSRISGVPMKVLATQVGIGDLVRAEAYIGSFFDVGESIRGW